MPKEKGTGPSLGQIILGLISSEGSLDVGELSEILGVEAPTVRTTLSRLKKRGEVKQSGSLPGAYYIDNKDSNNQGGSSG